MSLSMHAASASIFVHMLGNLATWLEKAEAHVAAAGTPETDLLALRLAPDMLPFTAQVKIAADIARMTLARLTGSELAPWPDDPATLAALASRVRQAIGQIEAFGAADLEGSETREVLIAQRNAEPLVFTGESLLQRWALPNFFFHVTTAYALLRHAGVPLGKADYLGLV